MNVTFLIGNGFDINLGLDTRYSDFYPYFIKNASEDNMIKSWIPQDITLWADLEESLGYALHQLEPNLIPKFYIDKAELELLLIDYLEQEQEKLSILCDENSNVDNSIYQEMIKSMNSIKNNLSSDEKASIDKTFAFYDTENFIYEFISFNYTNTLDRLLAICSKNGSSFGKRNSQNGTRSNNWGNVLHIHGTTEAELILGVNDVDQINNEFLQKNSIFLDTFIKPQINKKIGQQKINQATKIIEGSHIICIFGMSLGLTDKMWWQKLIKWLLSNPNNKLIVFFKGYENELYRRLPIRTILLSEELKEAIILKGCSDNNPESLEPLKERIMISFNSDIFTFPDLIKK